MRKKSARTAVARFKEKTKAIDDLLTDSLLDPLTSVQRTALHDWSVIRLHIAFEDLILDTLVAAINQDTTTVGKRLEISLPRHLQDDVCEFLITQGRFFDAGSRSSLIEKIKDFLPVSHAFVAVLVDRKHAKALDQVTSLRNLAAHESRQSRARAHKVIGKPIRSAGAWLKSGGSQHAFDLITRLNAFADEVERAFPF